MFSLFDKKVKLKIFVIYFFNIASIIIFCIYEYIFMFSNSELESGIFRQIQEKNNIVNDVIERIFQEYKNTLLENIILDTCYNEIKRLENTKNKRKEDIDDLKFWKKNYRKVLDNYNKEEIFKNIIKHYANDIVGNFNPKVYKFVTDLLPIFMSIFFRTISLNSKIFPLPDKSEIDKIVILSGKIKELQSLSKIGTIILLPTHSSNMDSIVIGWALYRIGLPPFTYGAGKNLFTNPVLSYFMNNLGAYKVDRRIKHFLYKDILKMYSTVILERNYHSLFFPGGTRSRSGALETKLKLGLLGTGIKAYINNLLNNKKNPDIFVVPATINYHIVLEAETLIDDYLKETGKSRYIIEKDESSSFYKVIQFLFKTARMDTSLHIKFGQAFDLFGNIVDEKGNSYDNKGRIIDRKKFVTSKGNITHNEQRDSEYTKELGYVVAKEYLVDNIILTTNLFAFVVFNLLKNKYKSFDLYRILRLYPKETNIYIENIEIYIEKIKNKILELETQKKISCDIKIKKYYSKEIIKNAIVAFNNYYGNLIEEINNYIILNDIKIIYYYSNRLVGYNFENYF
ncbi:MAG: hypothetical protein KatS3mg068_1966 [Candidatus Sericytochromatia bacterium]|nr:MAG: hypothetical protein KatS3mg068_1966 [Candidatus Sericytochromatia bacterium]